MIDSIYFGERYETGIPKTFLGQPYFINGGWSTDHVGFICSQLTHNKWNLATFYFRDKTGRLYSFGVPVFRDGTISHWQWQGAYVTLLEHATLVYNAYKKEAWFAAIESQILSIMLGAEL